MLLFEVHFAHFSVFIQFPGLFTSSGRSIVSRYLSRVLASTLGTMSERVTVTDWMTWFHLSPAASYEDGGGMPLAQGSYDFGSASPIPPSHTVSRS